MSALDECMARMHDLPRVGGVYLLIRRGRVVYVGTSNNVPSRISSHRGVIKFDRAVWRQVDDDHRRAYEGALIRFFQPALNISAPAFYGGADNRILEEFGLPPHDDEGAVEAAWRARTRAYRNAVLREVRKRASNPDEVSQ